MADPELEPLPGVRPDAERIKWLRAQGSAAWSTPDLVVLVRRFQVGRRRRAHPFPADCRRRRLTRCPQRPILSAFMSVDIKKSCHLVINGCLRRAEDATAYVQRCARSQPPGPAPAPCASSHPGTHLPLVYSSLLALCGLVEGGPGAVLHVQPGVAR